MIVKCNINKYLITVVTFLDLDVCPRPTEVIKCNFPRPPMILFLILRTVFIGFTIPMPEGIFTCWLTSQHGKFSMQLAHSNNKHTMYKMTYPEKNKKRISLGAAPKLGTLLHTWHNPENIKVHKCFVLIMVIN